MPKKSHVGPVYAAFTGDGTSGISPGGAAFPGVDGAVATVVKVGSLATNCARYRIFGICNPELSEQGERQELHDGT
jgi:hypothetical protein